jgi:hypothetical protein
VGGVTSASLEPSMLTFQSVPTFAGLDAAGWTALGTVTLCVFTGLLAWVSWQQVKLGRQQGEWLLAERDRTRQGLRAEARVAGLGARRTLAEAVADLDRAANNMAATPIERFRQMGPGLAIVEEQLKQIHSKLLEGKGVELPETAKALEHFYAAADKVNRLSLGSDDAKAWVSVATRIAAAEQARDSLREAIASIEHASDMGSSEIMGA